MIANIIEFIVVMTISYFIAIGIQVYAGGEIDIFSFAIGYGLYTAIVADNRSRKIQEKLKLDLDE